MATKRFGKAWKNLSRGTTTANIFIWIYANTCAQLTRIHRKKNKLNTKGRRQRRMISYTKKAHQIVIGKKSFSLHWLLFVVWVIEPGMFYFTHRRIDKFFGKVFDCVEPRRNEYKARVRKRIYNQNESHMPNDTMREYGKTKRLCISDRYRYYEMWFLCHIYFY